LPVVHNLAPKQAISLSVTFYDSSMSHSVYIKNDDYTSATRPLRG